MSTRSPLVGIPTCFREVNERVMYTAVVRYPHAVVDAAGRVRGVDGLRVVDASIMPSLPRGNTNLPTIMVAEKISAAMLDEAPAAA